MEVVLALNFDAINYGKDVTKFDSYTANVRNRVCFSVAIVNIDKFRSFFLFAKQKPRVFIFFKLFLVRKKNMTDIPTIDETIHFDNPPQYSELQQQAHHRVVAISIDEGSAEYVYDWAVNNFINPTSDLVVFLNCRPVELPVAPYINTTASTSAVDETKKRKSHELLDGYARRLKPFNIAVRAIALTGDPREEVIRKVTELEANVLIMGSRQLGSVKRAFLGSVSDYCSHHSPCTVIIVRPDDNFNKKKDTKRLFQRRSH
ncbi:hypothetical protein BDF20DRAFT_838336 [Mycotypha africana]|uniref:uncharacterized protein n=1 Tax=Mycotypha africana TaxID=64632 RepID=UPI00230069CC|nr:uncharacterized protein BDF20DRAFT_838336 [Mycotypha africana]KAI8969912.1 hypothetical protein BDF20DRAFT_838336 [Mycotypha africana]